MCAAGVWGTEFLWSESTNGDWQTKEPWKYKGTLNIWYPGGSDWPCTDTINDANDKAYINTNEGASGVKGNSYYITLQANVKLDTLGIETTSTTTITIDLNGFTLEANSLILGHTALDNLSGGSESNKLHFIITDSSLETKGTLKVGTAKLKSSSTDSVIEITNGVKVDISSSVNNETSTGKLRVTGDGTGSLTTPGGSSVSFVTVNTDAVNFNGNTVPTPTETDTYYWTGNAGNSEWTTSGNWAPTSTGGIVPYGDYPGSKDGDTAVFDSAVNVTDFTAMKSVTIDGTKTVTIKSATLNAVELIVKTPVIFDCGGTLSSLTVEKENVRINQPVTVSGNVSLSEGTAIWGGRSFTINGDAIVNGKLTNNLTLTIGGSTTVGSTGTIDTNTQNYKGNVKNNGTIEVKGLLTSKAGTEFVNNGNFKVSNYTANINGSYSGTGTLSLAAGTITFSGGSNTVENLIFSGAGTVINSSTSPVTLKNADCGIVNVTFKGDFDFVTGGTFKASTSGTFFVNGDVNFTNCTTFDNNGAAGEATVFFYKKTDDTATKRTFTTRPDMAFTSFCFGGDVDIVLNGTVSTSVKCEMTPKTDEFKQASPGFTATLTGTGKLLANAGGDSASIQITRMSGSKGELVINADVNCKAHFVQQAGTSVTVNSGKTFSIKKDYLGCGGSADPQNELIVNGTLTVGAAFGLGKGPFDTGGNIAEVIVNSGGSFSVGTNIAYATKFTNKGTVTVKGSIGAGSDTGILTLVNESGTFTVNDSISGMSSLQNNQGAELAVTNSIRAQDIFNGGTIKASSLTVIGTIDSCASSTTSMLEFSGDGTISVSPIYASSSTLTNIKIDEGVTLTLGSPLKITGNIENNGTFSAGGYSLVLQGTSENPSKITGTGQFVVTPVTNFTGEFLSIGKNVSIREGDTVIKGAFDLIGKNCVPAAGCTTGDVFNNGWKLDKLSFKWTGATSTNWLDAGNWDIGLVPGIESENTDGVDVLIPDQPTGTKGWPVLSKMVLSEYSSPAPNQISLSSLQIGQTSAPDTEGAPWLTILDNGTGGGYLLSISVADTENVSDKLKNYGVIEYQNDFRIYKNGDPSKPINDVEHDGWVEYSGGTREESQVVTKFSDSEFDYANLLITGENTETQDKIEIDGTLRVWRKNGTSQSSLQMKGDLTLKGNFSIKANCKVQASPQPGNTANLIFAGSSQEFAIDSSSGTMSAGRAEFVDIIINEGAKVVAKVGATGFITINGNWTNNNTSEDGFKSESVTVTFQGTNVTVEGNNTFQNVEFTKANATINITGSNTFKTVSFTGAGSTVKFAASGSGSEKLKQTITGTTAGSFTVTGTDAKKISLTTDSAAPANNDTSTWWILDAPLDSIEVSNALISYAISRNDISDKIEDATKFNAEPDSALFTTTNWFKRNYYWFGKTDSSWNSTVTNAQNWFYDAAGNHKAPSVPVHDSTSQANVIISASAVNKLMLSENVTVKTLELEGGATAGSGAVLDFATYSVTVSGDSDDTTMDFKIGNNATLRFAGSGSESAAATTNTITGSMDFGTGVTFEYYGGGKVSAVGGSSIPTRQILKITNASDGTRTHLQLGERDIQIQTASGANFNEGIIEVNDVGRISFSSTSFSMAKGLVIYTAPATSASGDLFPRAKFYNLQIGGGAWLIPNGLICENFYFTAGTLSILSDMITFTVNKNFVVFGSLYDSDDKDWLVSPNTRFAYPDSTADFINPTSYSAVFGTLAGTITVGGNFYVNGTNLNSGAFNLNLPAKTAAPVLNTTESATSTMWGAPYAVVFNSTVSNCTANNWVGAASESKDSAGNVLFHHQNVTDGSGNTKFQFKSVEIEKAYSVSDSVICLEMNVPIKSLGQTSGADITNTEHISYNSKSNTFTGIFADPNCTQPVTTITDDTVKCYLKGNTNWNSDATATYAGGEDSTDYSGNRNPANIKTDISVLEGILFMLDGYTMSANYLATKAFTATEDHAPPVLVSVYTGQEEHVKGAANQKTYDAHNFIEFKYSEPVSIGDFAFNETDESKLNNIQAQAAFDSDSSHGGAITNETSGFKVEGFGTFAAGKVVAGYKTGSAGSSDTAKPHALYRRFSLSSGGAETFYPCRIRLGIAAFVDGTVDSFNNWPGYIDSAVCPTGTFTVQANAFIKDESGNSLGATNADGSLKTLTVKNTASITNELYGSWDCLPPVFAPYLEKLDEWNSAGTSTETRTYEIVGTVDSNTSSCINRIEIHLFDNEPAFDDSDALKWVSKKGWYDHSSYSYIDAPDMRGGVRYSSLSGSSAAFSYKYKVGSVQSDDRNFGTEFYQNVKSSLFSASTEAVSTKEDEPYFALPLNSEDNFLPLSTTFVITFTPSLCYITDLAGNRLIQTDSAYSTTKILHAKDITPPSFSVVLSPVGSNYVYAVFTKPLNLDPELVGKFKENITIEPAPSDSLSIEDVSVALNSDSCTAILFKMNRDITLSDVETLFLKINNEGTVISTPFGDLKTSYFRDSEGNGIPALTSHAISDFAINAVDVIYAYAAQNEDDGWNEQGIYGSTDFDGYAVHNFSGETTNDSRLLSGHDIVFQYKFDEGESRKLALVAEKKSALKSSWISDRYNSLTGSDWRIWLDCTMDSVASGYNPSPFSNNCSPVFEKVDGSDSLWNMTWKNDDFKLAAGNEYQFFFKILDAAGNPIEIDHDGDAETAKIPLYAFRMPKEQIAAGNFSFIDLWSFNISSVTKQRGGVTILNNVIDAGIGEKCTVEVNLPSEGNMNIFVMTLDGNIIKRLSKGIVTAGTHYYYWDGKNNAGNPVARGLYFVRVSGSGIDETRKVMVVK